MAGKKGGREYHPSGRPRGVLMRGPAWWFVHAAEAPQRSSTRAGGATIHRGGGPLLHSSSHVGGATTNRLRWGGTPTPGPTTSRERIDGRRAAGGKKNRRGGTTPNIKKGRAIGSGQRGGEEEKDHPA